MKTTNFLLLIFLCAIAGIATGSGFAEFDPGALRKNVYKYSGGATTEPSYVDNGSGSITVASCTVNIWDNPGFIGYPQKYSLPQTAISLTDEATNYIVADYNNGNPVIKNATDVEIITESDVIPLLTIYRRANLLHSLNWDRMGLGLSNKIHQRFVKTERYRRESGLAVTIDPALTFSISAGKVWYGATRQTIQSVESATDTCIIVYPNGTASAVAALDNLHYITTGSVLSELTVNRYAVNWIYRGIENQEHIYIMLGIGDYTLAQAQAAVAPVPPSLITSHAQLVAKVIIQKSAAAVTSQQSAFDTQFSVATASVHNELSGLNAGDFQHLTAAEKAQALIGSSTVDFSANDGAFSGDVDIVGSFTLNGVDVLGDINAALTEILGE